MPIEVTKIEPYTGQPGIVCMPLVQNQPGGAEGWEKTTCPLCSRECWHRPAITEQLKRINKDFVALCTECAIEQTLHLTDKERSERVALLPELQKADSVD